MMTIMEKKNNYTTPNVEIIDIEIEGGLPELTFKLTRDNRRRLGRASAIRLDVSVHFYS